MKNKSKLKKIKEGSTKPKMNLPQGWFIMAKDAITVAELKEVLETAEDAPLVEIWVDAGILEVELGEKSSMDIETISTDLRDEYSNAYIAEHNIKSLFYVSFRPEDYEVAKTYLSKISQGINGFDCGDTEDFTPVL